MPKLTVYYCANNMADSSISASQVSPYENKFFKNVDIVFTAAYVIQEYASKFSEKVFYFPPGIDFDKFNVRADMRSTIEEVVSKVDGLAANEKIKIEGNCDEWGTDEYNYALGLKRAKSVKTQLSKLGVDAKRLSLISYGESNPMCSSKTDNCWSQNRRVEFKILP